jgi:photosystem II stability/assembly factor-like uncharacterized protein
MLRTRFSTAFHYLEIFSMMIALRLSIVFILIVLSTACGKQSDTIVAIAPHPRNPEIIYIATNESLYKTRDGGGTWSKMTTGLSSFRVLTLGVDPRSPSNVFAGIMGDAVYRSPDGGQSWSPYNAGLKEHVSIVLQILFHPTEPDTIYAATTVGVFRSTDGGRLWTERMHGMKEVHYVVTIALDPHNPDVMYAGTTGGVYKTTDGTGTWHLVNNGLIPKEKLDAAMALGVNSVVTDRPGTVYAGTTNGLFRTTDAGASWQRIEKGLTDNYISVLLVDPTNPAILYAGTRKGVHKTMDSGDTWTEASHGLTTLNIRAMALSPLNPHTLFAGTNGSGLFRSIDSAQTWQHLPLNPAPIVSREPKAA